MILVTGGLGFIGAHMGCVLAKAGLPYVMLDNLENASPLVLTRLKTITGAEPEFVKADICDGAALERVFARYPITAVLHFAALKAVSESYAMPLRYHANNVGGLLTLLMAMSKAGVKHLVFSSSATVYGDPACVPVSEDAPFGAFTPYGHTKMMAELILADVAKANPDWAIASLRYFNPVGAHESGWIGEEPKGIPGNLMPYIAQVAIGKRSHLNIYGADYKTPDGTGVRDYIHVMDLAEGHLAALTYLQAHNGLSAFNLGTGKGVSVLEMVAAFEAASGRPIPYKIAPRREGDASQSYANVTKAKTYLGWHAKRDLQAMCEDSWRWQVLNPEGYATQDDSFAANPSRQILPAQ